MKQYYYTDCKNQFGPFSKIELKNIGISKETLVWFEGLSDWKKAIEIEDLADLFPQKQTPPPLPNQKLVVPQSLISNAMTMVESEQKKKSKKKTIICFFSVIFMVIVVGICILGYDFYETKHNEKFHPQWYLFIENKNIDANTLTGYIRNTSKHTTYRQIQIAFSYYDYYGNILETNIYTIDGSYSSNSSIPFDVKIRKPQGLRNRVNWEKWSVEIIGAEAYN